jgi:hypothetical protein
MGRLVQVLNHSCSGLSSNNRMVSSLSFDLNAKAVSTTFVCDSIPCRLKAWGLQIPYGGL